jgi:hypothetical protein
VLIVPGINKKRVYLFKIELWGEQQFVNSSF